jgi:hypothetical protein
MVVEALVIASAVASVADFESLDSSWISFFVTNMIHECFFVVIP